MKKWIVTISLVLSLFTISASFAHDNTKINGPGQLFTLSWIGNNLSVNTTKPGWLYQFAGIKSTTSGFTFSGCTTSNSGYCLFSASDTVTASPVLAGPAIQPTISLCLNGVGNTYSCEQHQLGDRLAYVTNTVDVGSSKNTVFLCSINSTTGEIESCANSGGTTFSRSKGITVNAAGTLAYVTNPNGSNTVSLCTINTDASLSDCNAISGSPTAFNIPVGIALNPAGTLVYVVNSGSNAVSVCSITLSTCNDSGQSFTAPLSIVLNTAGTSAYVMDSSGDGFACPINADGSFGSCQEFGVSSGFLSGIALNAAGTWAYVTDSTDAEVFLCPINSDGSVGTCINSGQTFTSPTGIALNTTGTFAYVTSSTTNNAYVCPINADATLGTCIVYTPDLHSPSGIALF